jgi:hypothetical protein
MPSPEARGPQCQGPPQGSFCLIPSSLSLQGITQQIMELGIQLMDQEVITKQAFSLRPLALVK